MFFFLSYLLCWPLTEKKDDWQMKEIQFVISNFFFFHHSPIFSILFPFPILLWGISSVDIVLLHKGDLVDFSPSQIEHFYPPKESVCIKMHLLVVILNWFEYLSRHTFTLSNSEKQQIWKNIENLLVDSQVEVRFCSLT